MLIYGLSQTSGIERTLDVQRTEAGVRLQARDAKGGGGDRDIIVVSPDALVSALIDRPAELTTLEGESADREPRQRLDVAVRGNEVTLAVRTETGHGWDIAVGFDDFQDALGSALDAA